MKHIKHIKITGSNKNLKDRKLILLTPVISIPYFTKSGATSPVDITSVILDINKEFSTALLLNGLWIFSNTLTFAF